MHLGTQHRPPHRVATRVLLMLALFVASLTLTHCRLVGDRITGTSVDLLRRKNECTATCQDQFKARNMAEDQLHATNLAVCGGNTTCLNAEYARHAAAEADSKRQRDECMNACAHQQGGGSAGQ